MTASHRILACCLLVAAVGVVVAPAVVGPADASSPPEALCAVCGERLEAAAAEAGSPVNASESQVRIQVLENGSAVFHVRVEVNESAANRLQRNPAELDAITAGAFEADQYAFEDERAHGISASVVGDDLSFRYVEPDVATEGPGDVLLATALGERRSTIEMNADQATMHGPEGWHVVNQPASGDVEYLDGLEGDRTGDRVRWGDADGSDSPSYVDGGTYVAFSPDSGLLASANAEMAIVDELAPAMLRNALVAGGPSAFVLAVALAACLSVIDGSKRPGRDAHWLAVGSALFVVSGVALVLFEGYGPFWGRILEHLELLAVPAGVGAFGALSSRAPAVANLREAALRVAATIGVGAVVAVVMLRTYLWVYAVTLAVTVGGFYLVGVYDQRVGWPVAVIALCTVTTPILAVLSSKPIHRLPPFTPIFLPPFALLAALVGIVAYRIGAGKPVTGERVVDDQTTFEGS